MLRCRLQRKLLQWANRTLNKPSHSIFQKSQRSSTTFQNHDGGPRLGFQELQQRMQSAARHSVLIHHHCSITELLDHCQTFGNIAKCYTYQKADNNYALVEFATAANVKNLEQGTLQFPIQLRNRIATDTRYLLYRGRSQGPRERRSPNRTTDYRVTKVNTKGLDERDLLTVNSVSEQMLLLHQSQRMNQLHQAVRYFVCSNVEEMLQRLLPHCLVLPFGSAVTGLGKHDCDLDMAVELDRDLYLEQENKTPLRNRQLYFLSRERPRNDRQFIQRSIETIAGLLRNFLPQYTNINSIVTATVPIVSFQHTGSDLECDLCFENRQGLYMSELLYNFGELDPRVRPLVFTVRHWARHNSITHQVAGPWLSNFMLTLMVLYFLQSRSSPVLPSLARLCSLANGSKDQIYIHGCKQVFLRDWSKVPSSNNTDTLEDLLVEFFTFYASFDFKEQGISLVEGHPVGKPEAPTVFYMENPLEPQLNVSKNVLEPNLEQFQRACAESRKRLEKSSVAERSERGQASRPWGLGTVLLEEKLVANFRSSSSSGSRLSIGVKDLFAADPEQSSTDDASVDMDNNDNADCRSSGTNPPDRSGVEINNSAASTTTHLDEQMCGDDSSNPDVANSSTTKDAAELAQQENRGS